ncbi:MAG: hypothetical protein LWX11_06255 [Firmicutes bacterium]|nr:hypothetical protein [Bacillota bacterium]
MSPSKPSSPPPPPPSDTPSQVRVQKRDASAAPALREKLCATCGRPFQLQPDQKFFDCPRCHQKHHPQKPRRRGEAQVLVAITCAKCGVQEYVNFTPVDASTALCRTCFAQQKREQKLASPHPFSR